jgi:hypothetical protein
MLVFIYLSENKHKNKIFEKISCSNVCGDLSRLRLGIEFLRSQISRFGTMKLAFWAKYAANVVIICFIKLWDGECLMNKEHRYYDAAPSPQPHACGHRPL